MKWLLYIAILGSTSELYALEEVTCSNLGTTILYVNSTSASDNELDRAFGRIKDISVNNRSAIDSKSKVDVTFAYNQKPGFADRVSAQWDKLKAIGFKDRDVSQFLLSPKSKLDLPPEIQAEAIRQKVEDDIAWEASGLDANELVTAKVGALLQGLLQSGKKVIAVTQGNGQKPFQDAYNSIINYGDNPDENANAYGSLVGAYYIQPYTSGTLSNGAEYPVWLEKDFLGKSNSVNSTHYYVGDTFSDYVSMDIVDDYLGSSDLIGSYSEIQQLSMSDWFVFGLNKIAHKMSPNCGCLADDGTSMRVKRHFNKLLSYDDNGNIKYTYFGGGYIQDEGLNTPIVSENAFIDSSSFICGASEISALVNVYNSEISDSILRHPIGDDNLNLNYMFEQLGQGGIDTISSTVRNSVIKDNSRFVGNFKIDESNIIDSTYTSVGGFSSASILNMNLDLVDEKSTDMRHMPVLTIANSRDTKYATLSGKVTIGYASLDRVTAKDSTTMSCGKSVNGESCDPMLYSGIIISSANVSDSELFLEKSSDYFHWGAMSISGGANVKGVELHNSNITHNSVDASGSSFIAKGSDISSGIEVSSGSTVKLTSLSSVDSDQTGRILLSLSGSFTAGPSLGLDGFVRLPKITFGSSIGDLALDRIYFSGTSKLLGSSLTPTSNYIPIYKSLNLDDVTITSSEMSARGLISGAIISNSSVYLSGSEAWGTGISINNKSWIQNSALGDGALIDSSRVAYAMISGADAKILNNSTVFAEISGDSVTIDNSGVEGKISGSNVTILDSQAIGANSNISGSDIEVNGSSVLNSSTVTGSSVTITSGSIVRDSTIFGNGIIISYSGIFSGASIDKDKASNYCDSSNANAPETKVENGVLYYNSCFNPVPNPFNSSTWIPESLY